MRSRAALLGWLVAAAGCAPDPVEQAELGEVCGEPAPLRVLELAADEGLRFEPPLRVGDRVLYLVHEQGPVAPGESVAPVLATRVWSTGPCGESPVELASGIVDIFTIDAWPDVPLGCVEATGDVVSLDPTGARAPHVVFADVAHTLGFGCGLRWTSHGLLALTEHDDELGALRLLPYPADPDTDTATPVTLLDPIRLTPGGRGGPGLVGWALQSFEEFALALTADDTLVRVDLADRSVTPLQAGVWGFDASREGAFVLWQGTTFVSEDEHYPTGQVLLRELATGVDAPLAETSLRASSQPLNWAEHGVVTLALGSSPTSATVRLFSLPELEFVDLSPRTYLSTRVDDERWLASSLLDARLELIEPRKREKRRLFGPAGWRRLHGTEAVDVLEVRQCCVDGDERDEGPVWRVPLDGSAPTKLIPRATRYLQRLADGRFVTPVDIDAQMIGTLLLVDPETQQELRIDDRVSAGSLDVSRATDEGIIGYSVSDGARSGVYLARLPPHTSERQVASPAEALELEVQPGPDGRPIITPRTLRTLP